MKIFLPLLLLFSLVAQAQNTIPAGSKVLIPNVDSVRVGLKGDDGSVRAYYLVDIKKAWNAAFDSTLTTLFATKVTADSALAVMSTLAKKQSLDSAVNLFITQLTNAFIAVNNNHVADSTTAKNRLDSTINALLGVKNSNGALQVQINNILTNETNLQGQITANTNALSTKADQSALVAANNNITGLQGQISSTNTALAGKADSANLTAVKNLANSALNSANNNSAALTTKADQNSLNALITSSNATRDSIPVLRSAIVSQQLLNLNYASKDSITTLRSSILALNTLLGGYVTTTVLNSLLSGYVTSGALSSALNNYSTTTQVNSLLSSYVTSSTLSTTLNNYESVTAHNNSLTNYVTASGLTSTLVPYATTSSVNASINSALVPYALKSNVDTSTAQAKRYADGLNSSLNSSLMTVINNNASKTTDSISAINNNLKVIDSSSGFYYNLSGVKIFAKTRTYRGFIVPTTGNNFTINISGLAITAIIGFTATYVHPAPSLLTNSTMTVNLVSATSLVFSFTQPVSQVIGALGATVIPIAYTTDFTNSGIWLTITATY